jgi:beta-xylosidase
MIYLKKIFAFYCLLLSRRRVKMGKHFHLFVILIFLLSVLFKSGIGVSQEHKDFIKPILTGFYPDPSICRVSAGYYIVNSTFSYFPVSPVFYSKDLVHRENTDNVMERPEQLELNSYDISRGIFTHAVRCKEETFYITSTLVNKGGNFVVISKSPEGQGDDNVYKHI